MKFLALIPSNRNKSSLGFFVAHDQGKHRSRIHQKTKEIVTNLNEISRNLADISSYMNEFTKDDKLKKDISGTVSNINKISSNINKTLNGLNNLDANQKASMDCIISDAVVTSRNLRKFSEKLNKRFLLFRLMF